MGDCTSRPEFSTEEAHIKERNSINDKEFIYLPTLELLHDYDDKPITTEDEQDEANLQLYTLENQIPKLEKKLSALLLAIPPESGKLLIEIQKGKDIIPNASCIYNPKPYVEVELSPMNMIFSTNQSKAYIPY